MLESLTQYFQYLIMIVGCIEFIKGIAKDKKLGVYRIIQIGVCLIAGFSFTLQQEITGMLKVSFDIVFSFLLFLSLSTLCYDLVIQKIKAEKKKTQIE